MQSFVLELKNKLINMCYGYIYQKSFYCYRYLFYFNKILLFYFNENLHELYLHINIMHMCLLFYIVDDLTCRVRLTHRRLNHRFL